MVATLATSVYVVRVAHACMYTSVRNMTALFLLGTSVVGKRCVDNLVKLKPANIPKRVTKIVGSIYT